MTTLTHKRAKVNGVTLHYVTAGSGPTVLCMHGWPQNHREFLPVIEGLAEQYAFITPDLRGYADSDKPTTATSQRRSPKTCSRCSTSKTSRTFTFSVMISAARRLWHWPTSHRAAPYHLPRSRHLSSD